MNFIGPEQTGFVFFPEKLPDIIMCSSSGPSEGRAKLEAPPIRIQTLIHFDIHPFIRAFEQQSPGQLVSEAGTIAT